MLILVLVVQLKWLGFFETGYGANTTYLADNGGANGGNTYSYGATSNTDRALGTLISGSVTSSIGASYINNTGAPIAELTISYTGEQWRLGTAGRQDRLDFFIVQLLQHLILGHIQL